MADDLYQACHQICVLNSNGDTHAKIMRYSKNVHFMHLQLWKDEQYLHCISTLCEECSHCLKVIIHKEGGPPPFILQHFLSLDITICDLKLILQNFITIFLYNVEILHTTNCSFCSVKLFWTFLRACKGWLRSLLKGCMQGLTALTQHEI